MPQWFGNNDYLLAEIVLQEDWKISITKWYGDDSYPPHPNQDELMHGDVSGVANIMSQGSNTRFRFFPITYLETSKEDTLYGFKDFVEARQLIQKAHVRHAFCLESTIGEETPVTKGIFDVGRRIYLSVSSSIPYNLGIALHYPEGF